MQWLAVGVGTLAVWTLYRKIESVGKLMVGLWAGVRLASVGRLEGRREVARRRKRSDGKQQECGSEKGRELQ